MILVCGGLADQMIELMCARLNDMGYPYCLLDLAKYPEDYRLFIQFISCEPRGWIECDQWRLDLDDITGVYVRFPGAEARIPTRGVEEKFVPLIYSECDAQLMALFEALPCLVANRMAGGYSNHSKPYQALLIGQYGFKTPPTLVTSDHDAAQMFFEEHDGQVIYKSISGVRSIVRKLNERHLTRLALLRHGPAQFQALISGRDVRVHTVFNRYFATQIESTAVDYRYAALEGLSVEMLPIDLPPAVADACLKIAHDLNLLIAGVDLKRTEQGDYFCFEVNPSPGFLYYEHGAGQPVSTALAELLHQGLPFRGSSEPHV
jgi:hypothetical protein